ncbi:DUF1090 domain-containing protein [Enterobacter cloacae]|uniref:DUF1090 domain-containing protein n=1 Tax=Enterobacter cloacae complex TaxID=354276 RepID=UPI001EDEF69D|nr:MULTISPECIES: DUF1090 domain-containing protein [Enterobacter cloacae complex]MCG3098447.1 DUF1090 domain-containing protein [Enterobacter sp. DRP3]MCQ4445294.1 DUF1090 domain-containing protein [Enterobacter cloacae]MDW2869672.1 DUF1090 domain-containing protein [Enterobacter hormaechei]
MKHIKSLLVSVLILTPAFSTLAASPSASGCEAKRQNIEQQIDYARAHGNNHRIAGLEKALSEVNSHCTDEGLRAERESDVRKKEEKVEERRRELAEAQAEGRTDKISKKQKKLEEAQAELDEAKSMLNK